MLELKEPVLCIPHVKRKSLEIIISYKEVKQIILYKNKEAQKNLPNSFPSQSQPPHSQIYSPRNLFLLPFCVSVRWKIVRKKWNKHRSKGEMKSTSSINNLGCSKTFEILQIWYIEVDFLFSCNVNNQAVHKDKKYSLTFLWVLPLAVCGFDPLTNSGFKDKSTRCSILETSITAAWIVEPVSTLIPPTENNPFCKYYILRKQKSERQYIWTVYHDKLLHWHPEIKPKTSSYFSKVTTTPNSFISWTFPSTMLPRPNSSTQFSPESAESKDWSLAICFAK